MAHVPGVGDHCAPRTQRRIYVAANRKNACSVSVHFADTDQVLFFTSEHTTHNPMTGQRIGEATNPGPAEEEQHVVTIGLVNPTAILNKHAAFQELACSIFACSETSATATTQNIMNCYFRNMGYKQIWCPPVQAHHSTQRDDGAGRGMATGVSLHAIYPTRPSRIAIDDSLDHTRILSSIVELGNWNLHVIVIYGYPSCLPQARAKTDALIREAARLDSIVRLPSIICGDFNHRPQQLPSARILMNLGYKSTDTIFNNLYDQAMPNTCRGTTCHDQMILHPTLIQHVHSIRVDQSKVFHDHDPAILSFQFPIETPTYKKWKLPEPFFPYEPDPKYVAHHFSQMISNSSLSNANPTRLQELTLSDALKLWAKTCEQAVNKALQQQNRDNPEKYPMPHLPRRCKGRMTERKLQSFSQKKPIPQACDGQYTPPVETTNKKVFQFTKQLRRLQSLRQRVFKMTEHYHMETVQNELMAEWKAICNAKQPTSFQRWCLEQPELAWFPDFFPPLDFLDVAIQLMRHHTDSLANQQTHVRQNTSKFKRWYDQKHGHLKHTMKRLKGDVHPMLSQVEHVVRSSATLILQQDGLVELELDDPALFNTISTVQFQQHKIEPLHFENAVLTGMVQEADVSLPARAEITQQQLTQRPQEIAQKLHEYWSLFWNRDPADQMERPEYWQEFLDLIHQHEPHNQVHIDVSNVHAWRTALMQTSSGKARGYDGWHVEDLKALPNECLATLAFIFHHKHDHEAFPEYLMQSITLPLGKKPDSNTPQATRPITLLPIIYRLLAKVVCTQILHTWRDTMPQQIIGFIPGRSPHSHMIALQFQLEQKLLRTRHHGHHWQGVTFQLTATLAMLSSTLSQRSTACLGTLLVYFPHAYRTLVAAE